MLRVYSEENIIFLINIFGKIKYLYVDKNFYWLSYKKKKIILID